MDVQGPRAQAGPLLVPGPDRVQRTSHQSRKGEGTRRVAMSHARLSELRPGHAWMPSCGFGVVLRAWKMSLCGFGLS